MSKIEEALKKAKQSREKGGTSEVPASEVFLEGSPEYTRTRFQEVDPKQVEANRIVTLSGESTRVTEQYRMLRTQILQKTEGCGDNCLMVTSSVDGEGKSTTAINLAVAIAKEVHKTVLLVDADLRRPSIHKYLGLTPEQGLSHYLLESVPLEDLLIRTGVEKLSFLPAGSPMVDSTEILRSTRMQELIREVKERYKNRYVIFDTTPLLQTADSCVLAQFMDGIIFVVQAEKTPRKEVAEALKLLDGRNVLGVVMNNLAVTEKHYQYET
ncbi:MAG: polysaccharide biosynthesis tyrosine autokinase [Deltaproteobacteria bacterium]|nr:polysaccharide biosynthesis tyrosine autokinase [Deltaproteobacteria bacterium]